MLKKVLRLDYCLRLESGLHIGGGNDSFDIGGADSTVIKNPLNGQPYIPGSSIKGKIRSILTLKYGQQKLNENGELKLNLSDPVLKSIFAPLGESSEKEGILQVSRAIFRDAVLTDESAAVLQTYLGPGSFTEIKAENSIDPLSSKAANPRFIERVPAGAEFSGQIILQIFDGDQEEKMKDFLMEGLELLTLNYLGGSGTRGYGRISYTSGLEFKEVEL